VVAITETYDSFSHKEGGAKLNFKLGLLAFNFFTFLRTADLEIITLFH